MCPQTTPPGVARVSARLPTALRGPPDPTRPARPGCAPQDELASLLSVADVSGDGYIDYNEVRRRRVTPRARRHQCSRAARPPAHTPPPGDARAAAGKPLLAVPTPSSSASPAAPFHPGPGRPCPPNENHARPAVCCGDHAPEQAGEGGAAGQGKQRGAWLGQPTSCSRPALTPAPHPTPIHPP